MLRTMQEMKEATACPLQKGEPCIGLVCPMFRVAGPRPPLTKEEQEKQRTCYCGVGGRPQQ